MMVYGRILAFGFVLLLCLPLAVYLYSDSRSDQYIPEENRELETLPQLPVTIQDWLEYPASLQAYYQDNFGLREDLLLVAQNLKMEIGISPSPLMLVGKKNWLFLAADNIVEENRGALPLGTPELNRFQSVFKNLSKVFEEKGIHFVHFVVPEKQSIYPEYLPERIVMAGPSRLDQVRRRLANSAHFIDVKPQLMEAKGSEARLYYKVDFHWNCWGAYIAYREVIEKGVNSWADNVPVVSESDFAVRDLTLHNEKKYLDGQYWLSSLKSKDTSYDCLLKKDPLIEMKLRIGSEYIHHINGEKEVQTSPYFLGVKLNEDWHAKNKNPNARLKAIVLRDSFSTYLMPYFNRSFAEVLYIHRDFLHPGKLANDILSFDPDVVIYEYAERALGKPKSITFKLWSFEKLFY